MKRVILWVLMFVFGSLSAWAMVSILTSGL